MTSTNLGRPAVQHVACVQARQNISFQKSPRMRRDMVAGGRSHGTNLCVIRGIYVFPCLRKCMARNLLARSRVKSPMTQDLSPGGLSTCGVQ